MNISRFLSRKETISRNCFRKLLLKTSDFDYDLPEARIAQIPIEPRDSSRLMVINRGKHEFQHRNFNEIGHFLSPGDLLVINQTKVLPARIMAHKVTGGKVEVLLLKQVEGDKWECLVGGKRVTAGMTLKIDGGPSISILDNLEGSKRLIQFDQSVDLFLESIGEMPLPPYIHEPLKDPNRYQTVYAKQIGSAAAPTAGLHFTKEILHKLSSQGVSICEITLHVGLDTFAPVNEDDPNDHKIHSEWCEITPASANLINQTHRAGHRIIAVGTTSVRTLETAASFAKPDDLVGPFIGSTRLFILPSYQFRVVDAIVTNFHLPRSTLLMLVSAFASRDLILRAYREAIKQEYRFYSFGDAMLIL